MVSGDIVVPRLVEKPLQAVKHRRRTMADGTRRPAPSQIGGQLLEPVCVGVAGGNAVNPVVEAVEVASFGRPL